MYNATDNIITLNELCEILLIGKSQAYQLLNDPNGIRGFKIGKNWKIPENEVYSYIHRRTSERKNAIA